MSRLREERGGILVLSAVMIPVFLLVGALVVDAGNWFTHKRQLQNRADAGAFAAGTAYSQNWPACVYDGTDSTLLAAKASAARQIADYARQFSADPDAADYDGGTLPTTLFNANITEQSSIDVVVNSTTYDDDTDYTDDGDGIATGSDATPGDPCFDHVGDDISPAGGQWTDVRVKENKVGGIWRNFLPTIPARARIEIRPRISGTRFKPLAIPDNIVTKVQVRYFDQCNDPTYTNPLLVQDLAKLPDGDTTAYRNGGGGTLWGVPIAGSDPPVGDPNLSVSLPMTAYDAGQCGSLPYRPIVEQVRLASSDDVDLDASCDTLKNTAFADCFNRLSQIRIWRDGDPNFEPLLKDVRVAGGCGLPGDAYFSTLPLGETECRFDVSVDVDWGNRDDGPRDVPANFTVSANGTNLPPDGGLGAIKTYSSTGGAIFAVAGANPITITLAWADTDPTHPAPGGGFCKNTGTNPCKYGPVAQVAHRMVVGVPSQCTKTSGPCSDPNATGAVEFVHTSLAPVDSSGAPGASFDNWHPNAAGGDPCDEPCAIYPTVGTQGALNTKEPVILRTENSQGSQLVDCDPNVTGNVLENFKFGCQPYFGPNLFEKSPAWWDAATQLCPSKTDWYSYSAPAPYTNAPTNPWRCVIQRGGTAAGSAGDWMAVATDNCNKTNSSNTQCQDFKKATDADVHCANYEDWWADGGDSEDPRVIELFVVPYQSLKGVTGHDEIPILKMASFYVMNWRGQNSSSDDPCPDTDFYGATFEPPSGAGAKGTIIGVFNSIVTPDPGPVDLTRKCVADDPTPCAPVLVR
jgi:hypothetical protein